VNSRVFVGHEIHTLTLHLPGGFWVKISSAGCCVQYFEFVTILGEVAEEERSYTNFHTFPLSLKCKTFNMKMTSKNVPVHVGAKTRKNDIKQLQRNN